MNVRRSEDEGVERESGRWSGLCRTREALRELVEQHRLAAGEIGGVEGLRAAGIGLGVPEPFGQDRRERALAFAAEELR